MIEKAEFLTLARLDEGRLETWIAAGWIMRGDGADARGFTDTDVARARLIRELADDLSVNDEGVAVALNLLDQVYGLRLKMRQILAAVAAQPKETQDAIAAAHGEACGEKGTSRNQAANDSA